jgi:predicted amidophosphoribosyltransferase
VLVPVPISTARRLSRGIDHAAVIARGAGAVLGVPVVNGLRRKHGPAQSRLPASRRKTNLSGVFSPRSGPDLRDMNVIIVDDVTTTRATLMGACRALIAGRKALGDKAEGRILTAVLGVTPE